ncbi:hypothetical protein EV361DRAFT_577245 [Lentinula raphanica]|uniref:MYND-type domain-containing protein n=1 Tax=Lentinula raphanica TaxID=153919 RepID=A0AA38PDY4_9AGAR|nr:hypothetical protein F5878DRAFT_557883 [Lentinula raphanica]KAJ3974923.1 hypothetical protein EV361DRAFT_577245 [Lentinula raphanica]
MPTKGRKKKSSPLSSISELGDLLKNVNDDPQVFEIICAQLQIPDIFTKAGLKKVYFNFDDIASRLDAAFTRYEDNDKIVYCIVGIYSTLCDDAILRTKLYETGLLPRVLSLLNRDACREIALHTLINAGHHGGSSVRAELARNASILVQTLKDHPGDYYIAESIIAILSHAVSIAVSGDGQAPHMPEVQRTLDMKTILELTLHHMKQPYTTKFMIQHGLQLIFASAMHCSSTFRSMPDLEMFLVAGLKSKNWSMRGACFGAIIRSYLLTAPLDEPSLGLQLFEPEIFDRFPPHIDEILDQYGLPRCQIVQLNHIAHAYFDVLDVWEEDHDHYALGSKLADFALVTEYCLPAMSSFPVEEIIPRCLQELRASGTSADMNRADILELKLYNRLQDWDRVTSKAEEILARSPNHAFVFYALTLTPDAQGGLRAAKKGIKCKGRNTTPYLYFQLLRRAVEIAADLGLCYFRKEHEQAHGKMMWEEAIVFLMSALEDSRTFIDEAPPDHPYMMIVLYWNIILEITLQGPNANLKIVEGALKKLKIAEEISNHLELPILPTQTRQAEQLIVNLFEKADKTWGRDIETMNNRLDDQTPPPEFSKTGRDDLAAWLSDMKLETFNCSTTIPEPAIPVEDDIGFKRCAWCRNPSVALKKCSGCESARYCDIQCQRGHWPTHKQECKGNGRAK